MSASQPALPAPTAPYHQPPINGLLESILRSRLHGLASSSNLLIAYRGRRTGLRYELPVRYAATERGYVVLVGRPEAKRWWRNFRQPWPLTVIVRGQSIRATGHIVEGTEVEALPLAAAYFSRFRGSAKRQGLSLRRGEQPSPDDLRRAAAGLLFLDVVPNQAAR